MMPKRSNNRRSGKTGNRVQTALSQSEVWDQKLAVRTDVCHVQQRLLLATSIGSTVSTYSPVISGVTSNVGVRLADLGVCFSHWRINRMLIRLLPTGAGTCTIGVLDDAGATVQPAGIPAINDMRVSRSFSTYLTDSAAWELDWKPLDRSWHYCQLPPTQSQSDDRWISPFQLFAIGSTGFSASIQVYLDITFEGATDPTTAG
jgi:hypothetical protein